LEGVGKGISDGSQVLEKLNAPANPTGFAGFFLAYSENQ
jgi:hypothetical protein